MIKLLIQPIVENSILHGFNKDNGKGRIDLDVKLENDELVFIIKDDGIGMSEEKIREIMENESEIGHGIKNVNNRIKLYYGEKYGLTIQSCPNKGAQVTIRIPKYVPNQDIA
jgi:two-component system sensor histidine kinase YesM